ncbi:MAG: hypothetical protein V4552_03215 [Pseudomonadota bacterium]
MHVFLRQKAHIFFIACLAISLAFPQVTVAAEKKDKAAKRAALMMQKMKQDMEAEKTAMQAQFDTQKKALEDQLLLKEEALTKSNNQLLATETKVKNSNAQLKSTADEKTILDNKLTDTQAKLDASQNSLTDLKTQYSQALADLKFNDNQRKTQAANLAESTKQLNNCVAKNTQLHQFGTELVQIYDHPSIYNAVMRKENFFQLKRVELENILQNQQDKLDAGHYSATKSVN